MLYFERPDKKARKNSSCQFMFFIYCQVVSGVQSTMLRKPRLIGLTGRKGHGKDTVAKVLNDKGYITLRFADPLKNMLRALLATTGLSDEMIEHCIEGYLKEQPIDQLEGRSPRYAMQTLGTEWGRMKMGESFWVDMLRRRAERLPFVVVPDVRFANECEAIRKSGGKVYRVDAGVRVPPDGLSSHSSETEIDQLPVAGVIDNSGPKSSIFKQIQQVTQVPVDTQSLEMQQ